MSSPSANSKSNSKTQELYQTICHRYGWSAVFSRVDYDDSTGDNEGEEVNINSNNKKEVIKETENQIQQGKRYRWMCTVHVGLNDIRRFVTDESFPNTLEGQKYGKAEAAALALKALQDEIKIQESKPVKELCEVFTNLIPVYKSNNVNWNYFWQHRPRAVGIDTEGNQISPPVLVQIATDDYVIMEVPAANGRISKGLYNLLNDNRIIKVFCDNKAHRDKNSLGINVPPDLTKGHIVDIEDIANDVFGPSNVQRGVSRLITLTMPELNVLVRKSSSRHKANNQFPNRYNDVMRFSMIETGKVPPLKSIDELSEHEQQYAALDAWCTLQAYKRLKEEALKTSLSLSNTS